jgi:hypothetical protein
MPTPRSFLKLGSDRSPTGLSVIRKTARHRRAPCVRQLGSTFQSTRALQGGRDRVHHDYIAAEATAYDVQELRSHVRAPYESNGSDVRLILRLGPDVPARIRELADGLALSPNIRAPVPPSALVTLAEQ